VGGGGWGGPLGGAREGHLPFVSSDSALLLLALCQMPPMLLCCLFLFASDFP